MTRFCDWPLRVLWKTGGRCTPDVGRDQVTRTLTCYCTRTFVIEEGDRISTRFIYNFSLAAAERSGKVRTQAGHWSHEPIIFRVSPC